MRMNQIIDNLLMGNNLQYKPSRKIFGRILAKEIDDLSIKQFLALLSKKVETSDELLALINIARQFSKNRLRCNRKLQNALCDGCGTGGDGKHTFNISTLSCLVAAGAGCYIAKHGNRAVTSKCGSSDLMESLGVKLNAQPAVMLEALSQTRFAYFHAPYYSDAFRQVQSIRKELAENRLRTIFNLSGPLLNPLKVKRQILGVYHPRYLTIVAQTLKKNRAIHALVFCGEDGMDELSTHQRSRVIEIRNGSVRSFTLNPKQYGFLNSPRNIFTGGVPRRNRSLAIRILNGKDRSRRRDAVLLNAAALLYVGGVARNLRRGILMARASIRKKAAFRILSQMRKMTRDA